MSGSLQSDPTFFWMRHCATMAPALPSVTRTWQMVGLGHNPSWLSYHVWLGDFSRQTRGCCDTVYCFSYSTTRLFPRKDPPKNSPAGFHPRWDLLILWMKFCAQKTYRFKRVQHLAPTMLPQSICRSAVVEGWTCGKKSRLRCALPVLGFGISNGQLPESQSLNHFLPTGSSFWGWVTQFPRDLQNSHWNVSHSYLCIFCWSEESRVLMIQQFILWLALQWLEPLPLSSCAASNLHSAWSLVLLSHAGRAMPAKDLGRHCTVSRCASTFLSLRFASKCF